MKNLFVLGIFFLVSFSSCDSGSNKESDDKFENGELYNSFQSSDLTDSSIYQSNYDAVQKDLLEKGWRPTVMQNGQFPICYNYKPVRGNVENRLAVEVGGGTDVVIKVMKIDTNECIRYVFVGRNSMYNIANIPEGKYYLKIAYGKDWFSRLYGRKCFGKFLRNATYERGDDILDFTVQYSKDSKSIPSFSLKLDVVSSGIVNSFNSQEISEEDFND